MADHALDVSISKPAGACTCHDTGVHGDPVLDARQIPHAIRHAAIFGALDSLAPGSAMVVVAPHDPIPLLAQAQRRYEGGVTVEYLQSGPEAWHVRIER